MPFNQVYGPGLPEGEALPTLLTRDAVLQTLKKSERNNPMKYMIVLLLALFSTLSIAQETALYAGSGKAD